MQISTLNKENPLSGFPKNSRWIYPPALDQAYQVPYFPSLHRRYSLVNSSATAGTRAKTTNTPHSRKDGKCVLNIGCRKGRLTAASISTMDSPTAYCMYLFDNIPSLKMDCLSERTVYARNSSHRLSVTNRMVRLMIGSDGGRGGRSMIAGSPFSIASARAGAPSVSRFSHSNWITVSGAGNPASVARKMIMISATFDDIRKQTNLRMLS